MNLSSITHTIPVVINDRRGGTLNVCDVTIVLLGTRMRRQTAYGGVMSDVFGLINCRDIDGRPFSLEGDGIQELLTFDDFHPIVRSVWRLFKCFVGQRVPETDEAIKMIQREVISEIQDRAQVWYDYECPDSQD